MCIYLWVYYYVFYYVYLYVPINCDYLNIFLMGVFIWVFICALNRAYLNILTLFFYKCVWLKPNR